MPPICRRRYRTGVRRWNRRAAAEHAKAAHGIVAIAEMEKHAILARSSIARRQTGSRAPAGIGKTTFTAN